MRLILRRLRGVLGTALFWGFAWFLVALAFLGVQSLRGIPFYLSGAVFQAALAGTAGAITGSAFSGFVAARFRRRRFEDLRPRQFALGGLLIGALAGLLWMLWLLRGSVFFPPTVTEVLMPMAVFGTLGGVTALGTIKIAQKSLSVAEQTLLE